MQSYEYLMVWDAAKFAPPQFTLSTLLPVPEFGPDEDAFSLYAFHLVHGTWSEAVLLAQELNVTTLPTQAPPSRQALRQYLRENPEIETAANQVLVRVRARGCLREEDWRIQHWDASADLSNVRYSIDEGLAVVQFYDEALRTHALVSLVIQQKINPCVLVVTSPDEREQFRHVWASGAPIVERQTLTLALDSAEEDWRSLRSAVNALFSK